MKRSITSTVVILIIAGVSFSSFVMGQKSKSGNDPISEMTRGMKKFEGFTTFYFDTVEDKVFIEFASFNKEFIYINSLSAGIGSNDIGLDRTQLGSTRLVKMERYGPKLLMIQPNYNFRAKSDNEMEVKAVKDAFARSVIWGFKVEAENDGHVLVDATSFLLRDSHNISRRLRNMGQGNFTTDLTRSAIYPERTRNFPDNSEFEVILTFTGGAEGRNIRSVTPSSDAITIRLHHSFVRLPDDDFEPREFDPRAGFIGMSYMDYASPISENIRKRFITCHRLKKIDPSAPISEAVEPIVYYLDPGIPEPIMSALMDGASWWNQAFEAAGFKNAFQVKVLPEGADPMDVRYNMINWVHRSTRGWSYGSSVRDPRTGEIIKGHVLLGSLRVRQDFLIAEGLLAPYKDGTSTPGDMEEMALARLRQLSAHEVGHTLGLVHNYSASMDGRASVMDYPHPLVLLGSDGQMDLSEAYDTKIGEWDKVAIRYGYSDFSEGVNEKQALKGILEDAYMNKNLSFLSDQDARPEFSVHPRAHLWDNGNDAAKELDRVLKVRAAALSAFGENNIKNGEPYATLEEVLAPIYFFHRYQTEAAVKIIGGLKYTYALRGDQKKPTEMIDPDVQMDALDIILGTIKPEVLAIPEDLLRMIPPRPLGYGRSEEIIKLRTGLTFDPMGAAEASANMTLKLLLNVARATRLVEYHARDSNQPGLGTIIDTIVERTWKTKKMDDYYGEIGRVVDMVVLRHLMALSLNEDASEQARAISSYKIAELDSWLQETYSSEKEENMKAHLFHAIKEIKRFRDNPESFKNFDVLTPPAGSPIGMDDITCGGNDDF